MVISKKQKHTALKQQTDQLNLHIRQNALEAVPSTKYLGVYIDNSLNWKKHIEEISKKSRDHLDSCSTQKDSYLLSHSKTFLLALLIHIFAIVAQSRAYVN